MSNVSAETLEKLRENMVGRRYKHFKGRIYIINDIAVHTESDYGDLQVLCRPICDMVQTVKHVYE